MRSAKLIFYKFKIIGPMVKCQAPDSCPCEVSLHENGKPSILYPYFMSSRTFISFLFNIYMCTSKHITIECKKCGHVSITASAQRHVIECYTNRSCTIETKCSYESFEFLDIALILLRIPHGLVIYVDYEDIIAKLENIISMYGYIVDNDKRMSGNSIIAKCIFRLVSVECVICRKQYDSFPSEEMCIKHMNNCFAIGCGTCVFDTR